jgi:hypothetical protein
MLLEFTVIVVPAVIATIVFLVKRYFPWVTIIRKLSPIYLGMMNRGPGSVSRRDIGEQCQMLSYGAGGISYAIYLPKASPSHGYRFYLLYEDGRRLDITQESGIPYLVSAKQLGGTAISAERGGYVAKTWMGDEKPVIDFSDRRPTYEE